MVRGIRQGKQNIAKASKTCRLDDGAEAHHFTRARLEDLFMDIRTTSASVISRSAPESLFARKLDKAGLDRPRTKDIVTTNHTQTYQLTAATALTTTHSTPHKNLC